MFSEVAAIYPITHRRQWQNMLTNGQQKAQNMFGEKVQVQEMQSEGGAAAAMHGSFRLVHWQLLLHLRFAGFVAYGA